MNNDLNYNYNKLCDVDYFLSLSGLSEQKRIELLRQKRNIENKIEYLERQEQAKKQTEEAETSQGKYTILIYFLSIPLFMLVYYLSYYFFTIILKL